MGNILSKQDLERLAALKLPLELSEWLQREYDARAGSEYGDGDACFIDHGMSFGELREWVDTLAAAREAVPALLAHIATIEPYAELRARLEITSPAARGDCPLCNGDGNHGTCEVCGGSGFLQVCKHDIRWIENRRDGGKYCDHCGAELAEDVIARLSARLDAENGR